MEITDRKRTQFSLMLDRDLRRWVRQVAFNQDEPQSDVINRAIRYYMEAIDRDTAA
jgi:predicted transcriptional regulator